jgi:hypothetical protein
LGPIGVYSIGSRRTLLWFLTFSCLAWDEALYLEPIGTLSLVPIFLFILKSILLEVKVSNTRRPSAGWVFITLFCDLEVLNPTPTAF